MFNLDLGFDIQGIARFEDNKLIIGYCAPFKEVVFNGYGAYIRETGSGKPKKGDKIECDKSLYKVAKEYVFIYFDFVNKYTLDSVRDTVFSQLNQKDIEVTDYEMDFVKIKTSENLSIKDACMVKITFTANEDFIDDCIGLVCKC
jgi:hypothetical protein